MAIEKTTSFLGGRIKRTEAMFPGTRMTLWEARRPRLLARENVTVVNPNRLVITPSGILEGQRTTDVSGDLINKEPNLTVTRRNPFGIRSEVSLHWLPDQQASNAPSHRRTKFTFHNQSHTKEE